MEAPSKFLRMQHWYLTNSLFNLGFEPTKIVSVLPRCSKGLLSAHKLFNSLSISIYCVLPLCVTNMAESCAYENKVPVPAGFMSFL